MVAVLLQVALLSLGAGPVAPQGVSIQVQRLALVGGASKADGEAVRRAASDELARQGYAMVDVDEAATRAKAVISGTVKQLSRGRWLVTLTLSRSSGEILDEVTLEGGDLAQAGTDGAKRLATEIRVTWGVRARIKL